MSEFMDAKEALELVKKNRQKRIQYYLDRIDQDKKVSAIKRAIEKAVTDGETYVYVHFWTNTDDDRITAAEKYFTNLGYDIFWDGKGCRVRLCNRNFPKPPKLVIKNDHF